MKQLLLVFLGGGLGSMVRFGLSKLLNTAHFPYGTLSVNILGSFIIGIVLGYFIKENNLSGNMALFLATGFCGGFTTFSAFSFENYVMLKEGNYTGFGIYILSSIIIALLAVLAGVWMSKQLNF